MDLSSDQTISCEDAAACTAPAPCNTSERRESSPWCGSLFRGESRVCSARLAQETCLTGELAEDAH